MSGFRVNSFCGLALVLSGVSVALWRLTHPWGSIAGAEIGRSGQWMVAHTFHFLAALFGLVGLLGLVEREVKMAGSLERVGFAVAFTGTILFAGTGVFTAFLWPVLAREAPQLTELHGPFYSPLHPLILVTAVTYSLGHILLGLALVRAGAIGLWVGGTLVVGAVLLLLPPPPLSPLPWLVFPIGGVAFGVGLAALGFAVRRAGGIARVGETRDASSA